MKLFNHCSWNSSWILFRFYYCSNHFYYFLIFVNVYSFDRTPICRLIIANRDDSCCGHVFIIVSIFFSLFDVHWAPPLCSYLMEKRGDPSILEDGWFCPHSCKWLAGKTWDLSNESLNSLGCSKVVRWHFQLNLSNR